MFVCMSRDVLDSMDSLAADATLHCTSTKKCVYVFMCVFEREGAWEAFKYQPDDQNSFLKNSYVSFNGKKLALVIYVIV